MSVVYPADVQTEKFDEGKYVEWVKQSLGYPIVDVELSDDQIKNALDDALAFYSKYKPYRATESFEAAPGITHHVWKTKGVRGVYDVQIKPAQEGLLAPNIESQMLSGAFAYYGVRAPMYDIRYYEYLRQWAKIASRELSSEPDYHVDDDRSGIWIYAPGTDAKVMMTVTLDHLTPQTIPSWDQAWLRKYTLALAKKTLGLIRRKFAVILGANKDIALDGAAMVEDAKADIEKLEEELKSTLTHLAPSWG
jgi:hypothetical protein